MYSHESWIMTERTLCQVQVAGFESCDEFMVWHFITKCSLWNL